jgi:hypothetical protein
LLNISIATTRLVFCSSSTDNNLTDGGMPPTFRISSFVEPKLPMLMRRNQYVDLDIRDVPFWDIAEFCLCITSIISLFAYIIVALYLFSRSTIYTNYILYSVIRREVYERVRGFVGFGSTNTC